MELRDDYYIIESLTDKDIKDGKIFLRCLKSIKGFEPKYFDISNSEELATVLNEFSQSTYRYLFISTHGDFENLVLKNEKVNTYDHFDIDIDLRKKRIFMSSCEGGSILFAKYFLSKKAYSVIGTPDKLNQITATAIWPTMVILFERLSNSNIRFKEIDKFLKLVVRVYRIPMHYYSFIRNKTEMKEYIYEFGQKRRRKDYELKK